MENEMLFIVLLENAVRKLNEKIMRLDKMYLHAVDIKDVLEMTGEVVRQLKAIETCSQEAVTRVRERVKQYYRLTDI